MASGGGGAWTQRATADLYLKTYKVSNALISPVPCFFRNNQRTVEDITQLTETSWESYGSMSSTEYATQNIAQTLTASAENGTWDSIELKLKTGTYYDQITSQNVQYLNVSNTVKIYSGSTVGAGTLLGTSAAVVVANGNEQVCRFTFATPISFTSGGSYWFEIIPDTFGYGSNVNYSMAIKVGSGYAGGTEWDFVLAP